MLFKLRSTKPATTVEAITITSNTDTKTQRVSLSETLTLARQISHLFLWPFCLAVLVKLRQWILFARLSSGIKKAWEEINTLHILRNCLARSLRSIWRKEIRCISSLHHSLRQGITAYTDLPNTQPGPLLSPLKHWGPSLYYKLLPWLASKHPSICHEMVGKSILWFPNSSLTGL